MTERIKAKMNEVIEFLLAKPVSEFSFYDFEILKNEYARLMSAESMAENNKKLADMLTQMWKT